MSDNVQFDIDQEGLSNSHTFTSQSAIGQAQTSGMAAWLVKKGVVKEESQAKGILVGVVFANIILTFFVIYFFILK